MGLFTQFRQGRRDDAELGQGIWRRAHDRFRRGLDRFHQSLDQVHDDGLHTQAVPLANELAHLLPRVRVICVQAQVRAPSTGLDVPSGYSELHRLLSRAGNDLATSAQALTMVQLSGGDMDSVRRRAAVVRELVEEAERLL